MLNNAKIWGDCTRLSDASKQVLIDNDNTPFGAAAKIITRYYPFHGTELAEDAIKYQVRFSKRVYHYEYATVEVDARSEDEAMEEAEKVLDSACRIRWEEDYNSDDEDEPEIEEVVKV